MIRINLFSSLLFISLVICHELRAQTNYQWVHPYQSCTSKGEAIVFDFQSGLYFCGQIRPTTFLFDSISVPSYGYEDGILCKVDSSSGQIIWYHTFGSSVSQDKLYDLRVINGSIYTRGTGGAPPFHTMYIDGTVYTLPGTCLAKFDTSGVLTWVMSRTIQDFAVSQTDNIYLSSTVGQNYGIVKLNSSGLAIDSLSGYPMSNSYSSISHIICDSNENVIWARYFNDSINFQGTMYYAEQSGTSDYLIVKCDSNLNIQAVKHVSGQYYDYVNDIIFKNNGDIALLTTLSDSSYYGSIAISGSGSRLELLHLDNNLNLLSSKKINDQIPTKAMIRENDLGEYYIGITYYTNFSNNFIFNNDTITNFSNTDIGLLAKLDNMGNILWHKTITQSNTPNYSSGVSSLRIDKPHGNKLFITGSTLGSVLFDSSLYWSPGGAYTALIIDSTYYTSVGTNNSIVQNYSINIFPNPTYGDFTILLNGTITNGIYKIYDMFGNVIHESRIHNQDRLHLNLENLNQGVYIISISDDNIKYTNKIIKM